MDIDARIRRRQRQDGQPRLIQDYDTISPIAHVDEPQGRGPLLETLLDYLDPVFEGTLPPNAYVHGPFGAGKSAVVTALFAHMAQLSLSTRAVIHTSTRVASSTAPQFVYVDLRRTGSEFGFYHAVLDGLTEEPVPEHGIGTAALRERLHGRLGDSRGGVVLAVDHVDDPETTDVEALVDLFAGLPSNVSWLAVGRTEPETIPLTDYTAQEIAVDPYRQQMLVDVLMTRASKGLARQALDHEQARRIATWADGNAHDAMAALFTAADRADREDHTRLTETDVEAAIAEVPQPGISLGRVLALPANKQRVLRRLVDLAPEERASVSATTEAVSDDPSVDLSAGTVKRYVYELADAGVVERVRAESGSGKGRPPSRVELRFPPSAFRQLYDLSV